MTDGDEPGDTGSRDRRMTAPTPAPAFHGERGPSAPRRGEAWRKAIHVSSIGAAVVVWYLPRPWSIAILGVAVVCALAIERARRPGGRARERFLSLTGPMLRPHERDHLSGATWLAIGYFLAAVLFPRQIAATGILYGGIGDTVAGLVGRRWGRARTPGGKSFAGFVGGLVANLAIGFAMPGIGAPAAIAGAVGASVAEFVRIPVDDNVRMTLGGAIALWAAMATFGVG